MDSLLHTCFILSLYCTSVVLHLCCFKFSLLLTFAVAHFRCFVFSLFSTFVVLHVLSFRTWAVFYFCFFSIFRFTRRLICTLLFITFLVLHFHFPCSPVPMILGSMFQISWLPNTPPPPLLNTFYPPVFVRCFVIIYFTSVVLHFWLDSYSTGFIMFPVFYSPQEGLPMFHLPVFRTFVVSHFQ